jgi:gamma-glutamylputrescine oxidase
VSQSSNNFWQDSSIPLGTKNGGTPTRGAIYDVVIVGGGFAGLSTAWRLLEKSPTLRIVVLEAKNIGFGASGRNAGLILPYPIMPAWIVSNDSETHNNLKSLHQIIISTVGDLQKAGAPIDRGSAVLTTRRSLGIPVIGWLDRKSRGLGFPTELLGPDVLGQDYQIKCKVGLRVPAFLVQPYNLAVFLRGLVLGLGGDIRESCAVKSILQRGEEVHLQTNQGIVKGRQVVLCTNAYTDQLAPIIEKKTRVTHSFMLASEPLPTEKLSQMGGDKTLIFDFGPPMTYLRLVGDRVLFGGMHRFGLDPTEESSQNLNARQTLRKLFRESLPADWNEVDIQYEWGGPFLKNWTENPIIDYAVATKSIVHNLGFGGGGVALSLSSGLLVRGLLQPGLDFEPARQVRNAIGNVRVPVAGMAKAMYEILFLSGDT